MTRRDQCPLDQLRKLPKPGNEPNDQAVRPPDSADGFSPVASTFFCFESDKAAILAPCEHDSAQSTAHYGGRVCE
jgi:hypothetical protein